jgi:hypothetical protein
LTWRTLSALASVLLLAGCATPGSRDVADDATLHQDITGNHPGAEVTFDGTLAADPVQVGDHEHLTVVTPLGDTIEVDHNTSLATTVPAHAGDKVVIHGQLYIDPGPHVGVHCTHAHTSGGCPQPGWVELAGNYYE